MWERGLLCRLDDRGEPVIQLSPPLVADTGLLDQMIDIIGESLVAAGERFAAGRSSAA
jgi:4-aminobutyrate aminotransferase-like enzyme